MKLNFAWSIIILSLLTSCATLQEFQIEVYQPASITIPSDMKSVVLMSRNLKFPNDTLQNYYQKSYRLVKDKYPLNIDSLTNLSCLKSLAEEFKKSDRFETVSLISFPNVKTKTIKHIQPLNNSTIQNIAKQTGCDGIIVLDMFSAFYSYYPETSESYSYANVVTANVWSVYDAHRSECIDRFSNIDTLYWDNLDDQGNYIGANIPDKKNALTMAADLIGKNYSKRLVPSWGKTYRNIIKNNNADFKTAALFVSKNKWPEAKQMWAKYISAQNIRLKLHAMYNLAVAEEMEGNLEMAANYLSSALASDSGPAYSAEKKMIRKYMSVIYKRHIDLEKINEQIEAN